MPYGKLQLWERHEWHNQKLLFDNEEDEVFGLTVDAAFHPIVQCIKRPDGLHLAFEGEPHSYSNEIHFDPQTSRGTYDLRDSWCRGKGRIVFVREVPTSDFLRYLVLGALTFTGHRFVIRIGIATYSASVEPEDSQTTEPL